MIVKEVGVVVRLLVEQDGLVLGGDARGHIVDAPDYLLAIAYQFSFILKLTFIESVAADVRMIEGVSLHISDLALILKVLHPTAHTSNTTTTSSQVRCHVSLNLIIISVPLLWSIHNLIISLFLLLFFIYLSLIVIVHLPVVPLSLSLICFYGGSLIIG